MLTKDAFEKLLPALGFQQVGTEYRKNFPAHGGALLAADFKRDDLMMNSPAFQTEAKSKAARSVNQVNINATVMRNITIPVPTDIATQQAMVDSVLALEAQAAAAQALIDGAAARKAAVVRHHLTTAPA